jgi:hypothetical protein
MVLGFLGRLGNGMIGMFLKLMFVLVLILVAIMVLIGIATYWVFVIGLVGGTLLSSVMYKAIDTKLRLGLPEFFFWGPGEILDASFAGQETIENTKLELKQKRVEANAELGKMQQKVVNLESAYKDLKAKSKTKIFMDRYANKDKRMTGMRTKKAIMMQIDNEPWVDELRNITDDVDWNKFM